MNKLNLLSVLVILSDLNSPDTASLSEVCRPAVLYLNWDFCSAGQLSGAVFDSNTWWNNPSGHLSQHLHLCNYSASQEEMTNATLIQVKTLVWTRWKCIVSCLMQLPGGWSTQSGAMMEGGMQLLNRDGHSISHNSKRHYHDSFVSMNRMRQRGLLCDIVLHVSNKEIKAHKVVLASCSPYFHAMFTSTLGLWIAVLASSFSIEFITQHFQFILPSSCPVWGPGA